MERDKVKVVCATCGSDDIVHQTYSAWDVELQEWVFSYMGDDVWCHDCADIVETIEQEIKDGP